MDLEELENYNAEEIERSKRAVEKCASQGFFNPRLFLEDKVHLKETYAVRLDPTIQVKLLLPFYEQIISFIRPFKSPEEFQKRCGVSVEELAALFEENRVIPIVVGRPYLYAGLEYLNPILEKKPPSTTRLIAAEIFVSGGEKQHGAYYREALAELAGRFKNIAERYKQISYFKDLPRQAEDQLEIESIDRYVRLCSCGYKWLAQSISRMENVAAVYYQLGLNDATLTQPFLAGGCPQATEQAINLFQNQEFNINGEQTKVFKNFAQDSNPFPMEIARVLISRETKRLKVVFPSEISLHDVLALSEDTAFEKAREALKEFDIAVKKELSKEVILDKKAAIDAVWDQTAEAIENMENILKGVKWFHWSLSMAVVGTVAFAFSGFPGLISLLGAGVALNKIIKPENPPPGLGSLPVALYKLEKIGEKTSKK